jgi:hypothetical protein
MLYRSPTSTGFGADTQLHLTQLPTHASLTAWPFFQRHGYTIQTEETVERTSPGSSSQTSFSVIFNLYFNEIGV